MPPGSRGGANRGGSHDNDHDNDSNGGIGPGEASDNQAAENDRQSRSGGGYVDGTDDPGGGWGEKPTYEKGSPDWANKKREDLQKEVDLHNEVNGKIPDSLKNQVDDFNTSNGFHTALSTFSSMLGLASPVAGIVAGGLVSLSESRPQGAEESDAAYAGRVTASTGGLPGYAGVALDTIGNALGFGPATQIGKVGLDSFSRSSSISGIGEPSGGRLDSGNGSSGLLAQSTQSTRPQFSARSNSVTPPVNQSAPTGGPGFEAGRLNRQRYGLIENIR